MYAGPNDAQAWQKELNVDACVRFWLNYGTPASKLIVGIPTYGKSFTLANQANHGIGAQSINVGNAGPFTGQGGTLGYNEICLNNWQTVFDNTQQVPYAFSGNQWVGYDNVQSVTVKSNYVVNNNLGGAMIWSLETDDFRGKCGPAYPLLNTIYSIVMSGNVAPTSAPTPAPTQGPTQAPTTKPTTQSPGGPFVCPSSGYFRDPSNCSKYYQCVGQTKYAFDCPSGTVFNTNVSVCDWPANVNC